MQTDASAEPTAVWLQDNSSKLNDYNMNAPQVEQFFNAFRDDDRTGKMMLWAATPMVNASNVNALTLARKALERIPGAVVLIKHGKGTTVMDGRSVYRELNDSNAARSNRTTIRGWASYGEFLFYWMPHFILF